MLLLRVSCSNECGVPFIALEGRWSVVEAGYRCGRTCDRPPLIVDGPDPWSLVGCKSIPRSVASQFLGQLLEIPPVIGAGAPDK
jgi:hypothetical protein